METAASPVRNARSRLPGSVISDLRNLDDFVVITSDSDAMSRFYTTHHDVIYSRAESHSGRITTSESTACWRAIRLDTLHSCVLDGTLLEASGARTPRPDLRLVASTGRVGGTPSAE